MRVAGRRGPAVVLTLVLLGLSVFGLGACGGSGNATDTGDAVLARVNGEPVTRADVEDVRAEARLAGDEKDADAALEDAIGRALVRQEAERLGVVVSPADVDERIAAVTRRLGGEEALAQALDDADMSAEQLRRGAEYGLLRGQVRDARFGDLGVSDAAARAFYRRNLDDLFTEPAAVDLSMIVVRTKRLGEKVIDELAAGASFARVAKTYTRDPASRETGGRLGWIASASLPDPLRVAVERMTKGAVTGPVEGPMGWYVLKVHGRRSASVETFAEVEKAVRGELLLRKRTRALDRWIAAERKRAEVVLSSP